MNVPKPLSGDELLQNWIDRWYRRTRNRKIRPIRGGKLPAKILLAKRFPNLLVEMHEGGIILMNGQKIGQVSAHVLGRM